MTRTQAWRKVAEAFELPREKQSGMQREAACNGMCYALAIYHKMPALERRSAYKPLEELADEFFSDCRCYWWKVHDRDASAERATFAGLMAAMTQRERDQIQKGL